MDTRDKLQQRYDEMCQNFEGGLSNTSTKKFDPIRELFAETFNLPVEDIYAVGSGSRPGNIEVRLSQGTRATTHTTLGLAFIVDEVGTPENRLKLTQSAFVTIEKFLGRGKSSYENVLVIIDSKGTINVDGLVHSQLSSYSHDLVSTFNIPNVKEVSIHISGNTETNSNDRALLPPDELITKVRDSFIKFWNLIDQHGADKDSFVGNFENALNPFIEQLGLGYTCVFQIIDFDQYEAIVSEVVAKHPEIAYVVNGRSNHGTKYEVASTHLHYRNYLQIIAQSDFRANLDIQKKKTMSVVSNTTAADLSQYLRAMRTKPFLLLAGISGTGKSRIVKQMAFDSCPDYAKLRKDATTPGNYCLVEVKPNWHDSAELIGYASQIGKPHYVVTPFVRFLAKAMLYEEQRVPFFVCLDEMNLAPVEQYFAEFLSVLESRKVVNGRITSEALIPAEIFANTQYERQLKEDLFGLQVKKVIDEDGKQIYDGELGDDELKVYNRLAKEGLRIPSNLIVVGTVNMDETTHQFSRKVIDRAMTIEMNLPEGEPFMDFFNNARDLEYTDTPFSADLFLPSIVKAADAVEALAADNADKTDWLKKEVATILTALNAALEDTPFKIAYRVQNELMLYFYELWQENKEARWRDILNTSVDQILMMKVLPRIEGDEDLLEKPLEGLANFCAPYPKATVKVAEMKNRLDRAHFTSYWP